MNANSYRGEVPLVLAGQSYVLRPTFTALVAAEEEVGALLALAERAGTGQLRLSEIVALFWQCLDRRGDPGGPVGDDAGKLDREAFAEAVAANGLAACAAPLRAILRQVLQGAG